MVFATRSQFFWSRFIATCVNYLEIANTQHIRYLAEKLLPTEMSRQNILYHVRTAEEKGWIATFASALEMTNENEVLFRKKFVEKLEEKVTAQRFVINGTKSFEPTTEEKIKEACEEVGLTPLTLLDQDIRRIVTENAIKRLGSTKEKVTKSQSLFMVLLKLGWLWLSTDPNISLRIIEALKTAFSERTFQEEYRIDVELLEIVSLLEVETIPELGAEGVKKLFNSCLKVSSSRERGELMNLLSMNLLIAGRYLLLINKLPLAEECLNRGIKYLRLSKRRSILMRKMQVDGLFALGFIYGQQGWFYKALGVYENIERIIQEEFSPSEPTDNLKGQLAIAKAELYLMMAWPSYTFLDDDYRSYILKSIKNSKKAVNYYKISGNKLKVSESYLVTAWASALIGRMKRAEAFLKRGANELVPPVPPRINALYFNAKAELFRKQGEFALAIKAILQSFDYFKIVGYIIAKLFLMTRIAALHVELANAENLYSLISYGDMSTLFSKRNSDLTSHVFLEFNKALKENQAQISFYVNEDVIKNHPEINTYAEIISPKSISPVLLGESFTILPEQVLSLEERGRKGKIFCIVGSMKLGEIEEEFCVESFNNEFAKFDELFQQLLSKD